MRRYVKRCKGISIHALVKRATLYCVHAQYNLHYFNPRPREEGDASTVGYEPQSDDFNPRPREEGDGLRASALALRGDFNPRPREEGDNFYLSYAVNQ